MYDEVVHISAVRGRCTRAKFRGGRRTGCGGSRGATRCLGGTAGGTRVHVHRMPRFGLSGSSFKRVFIAMMSIDEH